MHKKSRIGQAGFVQFADRGGIVSRKTRFFQTKVPGVGKSSYIFYFQPQHSKSEREKERKREKKGKRKKKKARARKA